MSAPTVFLVPVFRGTSDRTKFTRIHLAEDGIGKTICGRKFKPGERTPYTAAELYADTRVGQWRMDMLCARCRSGYRKFGVVE